MSAQPSQPKLTDSLPTDVLVLRGKHRGRRARVAGYVFNDTWPPATLYLRFGPHDNACVPARHTRPVAEAV